MLNIRVIVHPRKILKVQPQPQPFPTFSRNLMRRFQDSESTATTPTLSDLQMNFNATTIKIQLQFTTNRFILQFTTNRFV